MLISCLISASSNITKTRLNDPDMWFLGTNDNPGDYRNSGCAGCHVVYANDRDPQEVDPTPRSAIAASASASTRRSRATKPGIRSSIA